MNLSIGARLEPDSDADDFGDETQDQCPGSGGPDNGCPLLIPDTSPPETTITRKVPGSISKRTAKFAFISSEPGSTFECSLEGKGLDIAVKQFSPCSAVRRYSGLRPGRHRFQVRAIDVAGNIDPSAAKAKFKVLQHADN